MKIGILVAGNPYGTTLTFSQELQEALIESGQECKIYPLYPETFSDSLSEIFDDTPDYTCSFSDITVGGIPIGECLQKTHLTMLLDPAIYFLHQIKAPHSIVSCVDVADVERMNELGYSTVHYLPHAISSKHFEYPYEEGDRCYEAVFFGTCIDFEEVRRSWRCKYTAIQVRCLENASDRVILEPYPSILEALLEELTLASLNPATENIALLHHEIDLFVRGKDRYELILACSKQCKVHVWGEGVKGASWEHLFCNPSIELFSAVGFTDTIEILKKSRYLLNSTVRFSRCGHERLLYALAYGALPLTTNSPFIKQFLPALSLATYNPSLWNFEIKPPLLSNLNKARIEAQSFTWNRFTQFFNTLNLIF